MIDLILASGSPRRRELLGRLGVSFRVRGADIDEDIPETNPARLVQTLALEKARAVSSFEPRASIIAADTTVALGGNILNKPANVAENAAFIARLAGQWHEVFTGVCVIHAGREVTGVECTRVKFRDLSQTEIDGYAATGEGLDKAGGYGIQELGMALVERIEGDYFNVMGLPVVRTILLARNAGLELLPWKIEAQV
jgi:septum formation protein